MERGLVGKVKAMRTTVGKRAGRGRKVEGRNWGRCGARERWGRDGKLHREEQGRKEESLTLDTL